MNVLENKVRIKESLKNYFKNTFGLKQTLSELSNEQLQQDFIDTVNYIVAFNNEPHMLKEKVIHKFSNTLNLMHTELMKRNIAEIELSDEFYGSSVRKYMHLPMFNVKELLSGKTYRTVAMTNNAVNFIYNELSEDNIAILGAPGSGKTVLVKLLAEKYICDNEKVLIICCGQSSSEYQDCVKYLNGKMIYINRNIVELENEAWDKNLNCVGFSSFNKYEIDTFILEILKLAAEKGVNKIFIDEANESFFNENSEYLIDNYCSTKITALFYGDRPFESEKEGYSFKNIFPNVIFMKNSNFISEHFLEHYNIKSDLSCEISELKRGASFILHNNCAELIYSECKMTEEQLSRYTSQF